MSALTKLLWGLSGALIAFSILWSQDKDDSDPPEGRSGLVIYTDHKTGCQYLSRPLFWSLTPRMDEQGRQVCTGGVGR